MTENLENRPVDVASLLREGYQIRLRQAADKARLAEINALVEASAQYKEGSMTGHVAADGYAAKVTRKVTVSWDQNILKDACRCAGKSFQKAWVYEFKPKSARLLSAWLSDPETSDEARRLVFAAKSEKPGSPSVSYERLED